MGISVNGPSGIDTKYIIDSLVNIEKQRVTTVEMQKASYQDKIDAYSKLQQFISDLKSKASNFSKITSFDLFTTKSSSEDLVTVKGGTGAVDGQYDIKVFQLATNEKMISKAGLIADQNASLSSQSVTVGDISIAGVNITVSATDTIQDLRMKINSATDSNGAKLGVTASVVKVADNDFRLVLTAKESGSTGIAYKDVSGSTLQNLGIITNAAGEKGNVAQVLQSTNDINAAFSALADGAVISYAGKDHAGGDVSGNFIKTAGKTINDFLQHINNTYHGMVDATIDGSGKLVLTDKVKGESQLSMTSLNVGGTAQTVSTTTTGVRGAGLLSVGKDAYFSVEDIAMKSTSNSATGFIAGVTLELKGTSSTKSSTVTLTRDLDGIKKKFQDIVDGYNALVRFNKESTKAADSKVKNSRNGALYGDLTIGTVLSQIRGVFRQQFDLFDGATYTNLTSVGLKTDAKTGEMSIDSEMFKEALQTKLDEVIKLFTTTGSSNNGNVALGKNTIETASGKYVLEEVDSEHIRARLANGTEWYTSDARSGNIVTFSSGPVKGLTITAPTGSLGGTTANFTFMKGFSTQIEDIVSKLTDGQTGTVKLRQDSLRKQIDYADERITKLNDRIEKYRLRLTKQFSDMEQAMSSLQTQSSKISGLNYSY